MNEHSLVRCMTALMLEPWLLTPAMHSTLVDICVAHMTAADAQHVKAAMFAKNPASREYAVNSDGTAVIPMDGVIGRKFSSSLYSSGVTSVDVLGRLVRAAADDASVKAIMLLTDSPGGSVSGVSEAARTVAEATAKKPVVAYADGMMCSAAYWIASQANAIYAWDEAVVGSIGVYSAILDTSRKAANEGVVVEMFKSGKFKGMGHPGTSMTDEERQMMQKRVDEIGANFRATVRAGRGVPIADETMQGQAFTARESTANGLTDGILTLNEALTQCVLLAKARP